MTNHQKPSETAGVAAYLRAFAHTELYNGENRGDYLAHRFIPPEWAASLQSPEARAHVKQNIMSPGMYSYITARTANFDDVFKQTLASGFQQIVILGAGYDTRALRFQTEIGSARVFELDSPGTQSAKHQGLKNAGLSFPENLQFDSLDFRRDQLKDKLGALGFDSNQKTLFIMEGLTMYLNEETVDKVFSEMRDLAAPGSQLVFDYVRKSAVEDPDRYLGAKDVLGRADSEHGEPFLFHIDAPNMDSFLAQYGMVVIHNHEPEHLENLFMTQFDKALTGPVNGLFGNALAEFSGQE